MSSAGAAACDSTISRLIKRAARRVFAEGDLSQALEKCSVSLPATPASIAEYFRLERFSDREEYHARLQAFVKKGAVISEWDRSAGERVQLARVTLVDPRAAADMLRIGLPWEIASQAILELQSVAKDGLPPIEHITDGWRRGEAPGGVAAKNARQFVDSLRVIDTARRLGAEKKDQLLRRLSANLFGDSKRIELLARPIAYLLGDSEHEEGDVFVRLGLVKHPQPMLISGSPSFGVRIYDTVVSLVRPYLGLRPDTVAGLQLGKERVRQILTIENLASFNEAAQDRSNPHDLLIIYVAGNPTPSLLAAYGRILKSADPSRVLHWGDIDVGGFRIAARLAEQVMALGHKLELYRMSPTEKRSDQSSQVEDCQIRQIEVICEKYGWSRELDALKRSPAFQEQEFLEWEPSTL